MEEHPQARFIVETLAKAGFTAYYAGGWVRDLLLKHPSDDIDIATNAPPETVRALFPHTVPVGIAFGIIIVIIDGRQYEVATFRQDLDYKDGRRPSRIEFATAVEDAKRRDFTINGMFYDPLTEEIFDYVDGKSDLAAKIIRAIGNPHERIKEDRLRMIRAIRLACRFNFHIEIETEKAIRAHADELLPAVAVERIWQEFTKGHDFKKLHPMLIKLHEFGLLSSIFPPLKGVSLKELKERLRPLEHYPNDAPVIAFILPLFPEDSLQEQLQLCKRMKLSNPDQQFVIFLSGAHQLKEPVEWAHFYAHPFGKIALQIMGAHQVERGPFLEKHKKQMDLLHRSIERIRSRDPVVKAEDLMQAGIQPGVAMGILLKEAEKISVNEQIDTPAPIIKRLKMLPIWPKSSI